MQVTFQDRAPLEKVRRLADGRITAIAKFARSGCYVYDGSEMGRPDLRTVTVYRPEDEVFAAAAMASFAHKAITLDHPADGPVTPDNWSKLSVGFTEGRVARDGGYVEIPLMLADASAVEAYETGRARELSAGYSCELIWGDGIAPDGTRYQATQRQIRGNHIALVPKGRAGSRCRIGDSAMNNTIVNDEVDAYVARDRQDHVTKFAFLGVRAPAFDEGLARVKASGKIAAQAGNAVRNALAADRYQPAADNTRLQGDGKHGSAIHSTGAPSDEIVRNTIRDARYR